MLDQYFQVHYSHTMNSSKKQEETMGKNLVNDNSGRGKAPKRGYQQMSCVTRFKGILHLTG